MRGDHFFQASQGSRPVLKHANIWQAIDRLARERGLTTSGLAKLGGLDPTSLNKSKRHSQAGKPRWPSTESIAKILDATGTSLSEFLDYAGEDGGSMRILPLIGTDRVTRRGLFDDFGHPIGEEWDSIPFPNMRDRQAFALEVTDDSMEPCYREGDVVVASPNTALRRGDRVLIRRKDSSILAMELVRRSARRIELKPFAGQAAEVVMTVDDIDWMVRIVWSSQ